MRVLLLSDIHSNLTALDTVLAHAPAHEPIWCLGDIVGYGPKPNECIERLRGLNVTSLAGNHDWAVLDKLDEANFNHDARRAVQWTRSVLKPDNHDWLNNLPDSLTLRELNFTLVHGSPRNPIWEYILTTSGATENLRYFETDFCLFGHTHIPARYRQSSPGRGAAGAVLPEDEPITLEAKSLLNPGSVGQPRDHDPRAAFALLDLDARTLTHYRLEYDIAATQVQMEEVNLPRRLIERLDYGV